MVTFSFMFAKISISHKAPLLVSRRAKWIQRNRTTEKKTTTTTTTPHRYINNDRKKGQERQKNKPKQEFDTKQYGKRKRNCLLCVTCAFSFSFSFFGNKQKKYFFVAR